MRVHQTVNIAGLFFACALAAGSAYANSISLDVRVDSPWSGITGAASYTSSQGLAVTSDPGRFGSVFTSGALNLTSNVLRVQLNKPESDSRPHNGWSRGSANLASGTISVNTGGQDTVLASTASFEDTVTFFNPGGSASQIHLVWNVDGEIFAQAHSGSGSLIFGEAFLSFEAVEGHDIVVSSEGWSSAPDISRSDFHRVQVVAPYTLMPGMNDTRQLLMSVRSVCSGQFDTYCSYGETLRFDLGRTGVTFTSGSGVLLTAVVPEPSSIGLLCVGMPVMMLLLRVKKSSELESLALKRRN